MNVTPVILTFNEDPNLEATLASLDWAPRVVIVDSGSTDRTRDIARSFNNIAWFDRKFDSHGAQWTFALKETSIATEFALALDADMRCSPQFKQELQAFLPGDNFNGAWIPFEYRLLGRPLAGSIYPSQVRLLRPALVHVVQPGHTQVFEVPGVLHRFQSVLIHEDRKPMDRWLANQIKYANLEASRIRSTAILGWKDRLRVSGISPAIWGVYAFLKAGGPFNATCSRAYAYERMIFESILARLLTEPANSEVPVQAKTTTHPK